MNKHMKETPLPLIVRRWDGDEWPDKRISVASRDSQEALFISARYADIDQSEEYAAFIVQACNEHYKQKELNAQLVKALRGIVEYEDAKEWIGEALYYNAKQAIKQAEANDE